MKKDKDSKSSLVGWKSSRSRHRIDKVFPSWQHQSLFSEDSMFWLILKCRVEDRSKKMLEMLAQELWTSWKRVRNHENRRWRKANVEYCLSLTSDPTGINNALQGAGFDIDLRFLASATAKAIHFWGPYYLTDYQTPAKSLCLNLVGLGFKHPVCASPQCHPEILSPHWSSPLAYSLRASTVWKAHVALRHVLLLGRSKDLAMWGWTYFVVYLPSKILFCRGPRGCCIMRLAGALGRPQTIPIRVDLPNVGMILTFGFP